MARLHALTARAARELHRRSRPPQRCLSSQPEPEPEARCRLSDRAKALAAGGGAAARVWEDVNALAAQPGMVNMGQGFPDYPGSALARRVAADAIEAGEAPQNQYSPQPGLLALRESVAAFHARRYGSDFDAASEVVVTAGAQEGLAAAFQAFLDPGDEVTPTPTHPTHPTPTHPHTHTTSDL